MEYQGHFKGDLRGDKSLGNGLRGTDETSIRDFVRHEATITDREGASKTGAKYGSHRDSSKHSARYAKTESSKLAHGHDLHDSDESDDPSSSGYTTVSEDANGGYSTGYTTMSEGNESADEKEGPLTKKSSSMAGLKKESHEGESHLEHEYLQHFPVDEQSQSTHDEIMKTLDDHTKAQEAALEKNNIKEEDEKFNESQEQAQQDLQASQNRQQMAMQNQQMQGQKHQGGQGGQGGEGFNPLESSDDSQNKSGGLFNLPIDRSRGNSIYDDDDGYDDGDGEYDADESDLDD